MTKYFRFLVCVTALVLSAGLLKAQAPYKFAYQAIVRSESNQIVRNTQVDVRIAILKNAENGAQVYKEKQSPKTNENGLYTIVVGGPGATGVTGTIKDIEWGNGVYFIKAEVDVDKDGTYDLTTIQQLVSVPYVFHANVTDEGLKEILANGNSGDASHNTQIKCLANPTDNNDVVNKAYLDSILAYIDENYGGCKLAEVKLSDITATENGCGTKLKVKTETLSGTVSYQWYRDNSPIPGATSASYDASNAGTYKVVATATCDGGAPATAKDEKSQTVEASGPTVTVDIANAGGTKSGSTITIDNGASLTLTVNTAGSTATDYTYQWSEGSTATTKDITPSTSTSGDKTYTVTVKGMDDNGCDATATASVTVSVKDVAPPCPTPVVNGATLKFSPDANWYQSTMSSASITISSVSVSNCQSPCTYTYGWKATQGNNTMTGSFNTYSSVSGTTNAGLTPYEDVSTSTSSTVSVNISSAIASSRGQEYTYHCWITATSGCGSSSDGKYQKYQTKRIYDKK